MVAAGYVLLLITSFPAVFVFNPDNGGLYAFLGIFMIIAAILSFIIVCAQLFLQTGMQAATYDLVNGKKTDNVLRPPLANLSTTGAGASLRRGFYPQSFNILWFLLFFIPGWIKALAYSQSLYIIQDAIDNGTPMTAREAITLSRKVMDGHKWELLGLMLSFFGWLVLSIITYGIGFFWTLPYMFTTMAEYHKYVMADYNKQHQTGLTNAQVHTTASFSVK